MRLLRISSAGDTIVEALMAITVLGMVIMSGFSISNYSLRIVRAAQERGEGLKFVEGQAERLRSAASATDQDSKDLWTSIIGQTAGFCIVGNTVRTVASGNCRFGTDGRYNVSITYVAGTSTFTIANTWNSIANSGQDTARIIYRVRQ